MSDVTVLSASKINTTGTATASQVPTPATTVKISREATKDAGRVHVGGAMMRF